MTEKRKPRGLSNGVTLQTLYFAFAGAGSLASTFAPSCNESDGLTTMRSSFVTPLVTSSVRAEILADGHFLEVDDAVAVHRRHLQAFLAEKQRVDRHDRRRFLQRQEQVRVGERSREQPAVLVVHLDLGLQSARGGINRPGDVRDLAVDFLARELREVQERRRTLLHERRVGLWHVHVHPQDVRAGNAEKLLPRSPR